MLMIKNDINELLTHKKHELEVILTVKMYILKLSNIGMTDYTSIIYNFVTGSLNALTNFFLC